MTPGTRRILIYGGTAAVIVLAAGLGVLADLSLRGDRTVREVTIPAEIAKPPAAASAAPPAAGGAPAPAPSAAAPSTAAMAKAPAKPAGPSFDVVRVEPSGENVVAGRAAPDSKVDLLANGKVAGTATADEAGQFVMTPPPLKPGSHQLTLRATDAAGHAALSERSVVVSVPSKPGDQLLVVAEEPGKPADILTAGKPAAPGQIVAPAATKAGTEVAALSPPAAAAGPAGLRPHVDAVETDAGRLFVQGTGAPGARLGIYLNGTHLADAVVGQDGHWSLTVKHGLATGDYEVRVDQLGPGGKVVARAAVPFDYHPAAGGASLPAPKLTAAVPPAASNPVPGASASSSSASAAGAPAATAAAPAPAAAPSAAAGQAAAPASGDRPPSPTASAASAPAAGQPAATPPAPGAALPAAAAANPAQAAANPVIEQIGTVKVVRGDSLWRISRTIYGHGIRYTVIYAANQDQIRDPDLIYPGQVFVIPPAAPKPGVASPG